MKIILIDGLNVVRAIFPFDHEGERNETWEREMQCYPVFLSMLKRLARRDRRLNGAGVEVYFDGKPRALGTPGTVTLSCACTGWQSADDKITARVAELGGKAIVMTFDRELARRVREAGGHVISPRWLFRTARDHGLDFYQYAQA
jgi:hypothetical protein